MSILQYMVLLHRDVPRAAQFYAHGLGLAVKVCTTRWAELQSGPCKIALMEAPSDVVLSRGYSPFLSFNVTNMDATVLRLLSMGAELDGPIRHPPEGKVAALRCLDGHMVGLFEPNEHRCLLRHLVFKNSTSVGLPFNGSAALTPASMARI